MPKHFAVGENIQAGTVMFNNTKTMVVNFSQSFRRRPHVNLTLADVNTAPAYKQVVNKNRLIIRFKQKFTGEVDWQAMEM